MISGTTLSLKGVDFSYPAAPEKILSGLDFEAGAGEWVAVLGPNGSGKSTMLKLFNALLLPTQGFCFVDGVDTASPDAPAAIRSKVALVFQNPEDQIVAAVVEEDTAFGPENLGLPSSETEKRVTEALKVSGLWQKRKSPVSSLSGGQKQRLALAGVLALSPSCLLLDEATSMLDPMARREFLELIKKEHARGMTVVQVTHRLEEILSADRVVVVEKGRITWSGTAEELLSKSGRDLDAMSFEKPPLAVLRDLLAEKNIIAKDTPIDVAAIKNLLCR